MWLPHLIIGSKCPRTGSTSPWSPGSGYWEDIMSYVESNINVRARIERPPPTFLWQGWFELPPGAFPCCSQSCSVLPQACCYPYSKPEGPLLGERESQSLMVSLLIKKVPPEPLEVHLESADVVGFMAASSALGYDVSVLLEWWHSAIILVPHAEKPLWCKLY